VRYESLGDGDRADNESNKLKVIDFEIKELVKQKKILLKSLKHQQTTMNSLYDDPEFRDKVLNTQNDIQDAKAGYYQCEEERKKIKVEQSIIINKMTILGRLKRKLMEEKILIENGKKTNNMVKAEHVQNEIDTIRNRMIVWKSIKEK
jgi:hypothetical protein